MKFFLDNIQVTSPRGWDEIKSKLQFDERLQALLLTADADLEFTGDGYAYLWGKLQEGFCNVINIRIQENCYGGTWLDIIVGKIFVSDCIFNERTCTVKVKVEDNSYFAQINNNSKIKTVPDAGVSKMGESITPAVVYNVDFYSLANLIIRSVPCVRVYEAFRSVIDFMSDGQIGFSSTLFDIGGDFEGLAITTGARIRTGSAIVWEPFSFEQLFKEVKARIPIKLLIENPLIAPVIRIEDDDYFKQGAITASFDDLYEVITRCDVNKLYAKVNVGSGVVDDTVTLSFPEDIDYFGFKTEELFIKTECNTNEELDLVGDWVVSSNVIEKTVNGDQNADDFIFLIDTTLSSATAGRTTNTNFLSLTPALNYFNERLTNEEILNRYVDGLPATAAKLISAPGDGLFRADKASATTIPAVVVVPPAIQNFATEIFDNGSYYDGTNRFTALNAGVYDFRVVIQINLTSNPVNFGCAPAIYHYDSAGNFIAEYTVSNQNYIGGTTGTFTQIGTARIVMRDGDYCQVRIVSTVTSPAATGTYTTNSYWECYSNSNGGGEFQTADPDDYPVFIHEFSYPINTDTFNTLLNGSRGYIRFRQKGQQWRKGRIKELIYDRNNGSATFKISTDKTTSDAS